MEILAYNNSIHRDQLIRLWKNIFGYHGKRNDPALAIDKKLEADDGLLFIAAEDGMVIGSVMAGYDGHRGWIYSLAVDPVYRRQKTGSLLLDHAEKALAALGCMKVNLQVVGSNKAVQEFYIKHGYKVEDRISMGKAFPGYE